MKSKQILILGIVFVVLIVLVVVSKSAGPKSKTKIEEDNIVEEFDSEQVAHIEFYHGEKPENKVVVKKAGDKWTVPGKFGARADSRRIDPILNDIKGLKGEVRVKDPALFGEFGITEKQAVHLIVRDSGGSEITHLLIGKAGADYRSGFVRLAGSNSVYPVQVALLSRLGVRRPEKGPVEGFEEKRWLDLGVFKELNVEDVVGLDLRSPNREVSFKRILRKNTDKQDEKKDGENTKESGKKEEVKEFSPWELVNPDIPYALKQNGIDAILKGIKNRNADDVVDPEKIKGYGFEQPLYEAGLKYLDESKSHILIGKSFDDGGVKKYYMKVEGDKLIYVVGKHVVDRIFEDAGRLFDLKAMTLDEKNIVSISLGEPEKKTVLKKNEKNKWIVAEPGMGFNERKGSVKALVDRYLVFTPDDFLNAMEQVEFPEPDYLVGFEFSDGNKKYMRISTETEELDGDRMCLIEGIEGVFILNKGSMKKLFPELTSLVEIKFADVNKEELSTVEVERENQKFVLSSDKGSKWDLNVLGYSYEIDSMKAEEIVNYFTGIEPGEVLGNVHLGKYGLNKPTIKVRVNDGKKTATILIGDRHKDGTKYYAADQDSGIVFLMIDKAVEAVGKKLSKLVSLNLFPSQPKLERLAVNSKEIIEAGNGTWFSVFRDEREKNGKKAKVWVGPMDKEYDEDLVGKLVAMLQSLVADDIQYDGNQSISASAEKAGTYIEYGVGEQTHRLLIKEKDEKKKLFSCMLEGREGQVLIKEALINSVFKQALNLLKNDGGKKGAMKEDRKVELPGSESNTPVEKGK